MLHITSGAAASIISLFVVILMAWAEHIKDVRTRHFVQKLCGGAGIALCLVVAYVTRNDPPTSAF